MVPAARRRRRLQIQTGGHARKLREEGWAPGYSRRRRRWPTCDERRRAPRQGFEFGRWIGTWEKRRVKTQDGWGDRDKRSHAAATPPAPGRAALPAGAAGGWCSAALDAGAWSLEREGAQRRSSSRFFSVGGSGPVTLGLGPVGWTTAWAFWTLMTASPSLVPRPTTQLSPCLLGFEFEF